MAQHSLGPKLKRRRDDLEKGPTMDFAPYVLQPTNSLHVDSLGSDCHGIVVAKHKRHAKGSQIKNRQTNVQCIFGDQTAGITTDTNISSTKTQHGSDTNLPFHSEELMRQHSCNLICQTSALEQKKSQCSLKNCTKSGKAIKAENIFPSHAKVMHHKQEVSSWSQKKCNAIDSNTADAFKKSSVHGFSNMLRKHRRLFSWQRHRKCKISCSGENLLIGNNGGPSGMNPEQNSDADFNHQPVESGGPFIYDIASELCDVKDQELASFPASVVMEDAEAINNLISHSVHHEEVYQGYSPPAESSRHLPRAMSEDKFEKESHAGIPNLKVQSMHLQETDDMFSHNIKIFTNLQTESPPNELLSNYVGSFKNQHILNNHSDKVSLINLAEYFLDAVLIHCYRIQVCSSTCILLRLPPNLVSKLCFTLMLQWLSSGLHSFLLCLSDVYDIY